MVKPKKDPKPDAITTSGRFPGIKDSGSAHGEEGTNKTVAQPKPEAEPSAELQGTSSKFIPKTPYSRG